MMDSVTSIIAREAFASIGWIDIYLIHRRYLLSPLQLIDACEKMAADGLLEVEGRRLRMTERGRKWAVKNRRRIWSSERPWAKGTAHLKSERMEAQSPYLPDLRLIDEEFFFEVLSQNGK